MIDVSRFKPGDYVKAEFRELEPVRFRDGWAQWSMPTGNTYVLEGELEEFDGFYDPRRKGLRMPRGQAVRQINGSPGGNLVQILDYKPKG